MTTAGLLVTPSGEEFIKRHHKILKELLRGLAQLQETNSQRVEIAGGSIVRLQGGDQSRVFLLDMGASEPKAVLKIPRLYSDIDQPYVNEILQAQELLEFLKKRITTLPCLAATFFICF